MIAWLILDIVAGLIVLHDYYRWYRDVERINDDKITLKTTIDSLPAA